MNQNITLFGGKKITVHFEPLADGGAPATEEIKVRQIPVREYEDGFKLAEDEPALAGFLCGKNKPWALMLTPESFEDVLATGREVNAKGFFISCQRRLEREQRAQAGMIALMATLPPDALKAAMEMGTRMQNPSPSPNWSHGFVPPPAR